MSVLNTQYHEKGPSPSIDNIDLKEQEDGSLDIIVESHSLGQDNSIKKIKLYTDKQEQPINVKEGEKNWVFNYKVQNPGEASFYIVVEDNKGNFTKSDYFSHTNQKVEEVKKEVSDLEKNVEQSLAMIKKQVFFNEGPDIESLFNGQPVKERNICIKDKATLTYLINDKFLDLELKESQNGNDWKLSPVRDGKLIKTERVKDGYRIKIDITIPSNKKGTLFYRLKAENRDYFSITDPLLITNVKDEDNPPEISIDINQETNELIIKAKDTGENAGLVYYKIKGGTFEETIKLRHPYPKENTTKIPLDFLIVRGGVATLTVLAKDKSEKYSISNSLKIGKYDDQFYILEKEPSTLRSTAKKTLEKFPRDKYVFVFIDGYNSKWKKIEHNTDSVTVNHFFGVGSAFDQKKMIKLYRNGELIKYKPNGSNISFEKAEGSNTALYHVEWEDFQGKQYKSRDLIIHNRGDEKDNVPKLIFGYNKKKNSLVILAKDSGDYAGHKNVKIFRNGKIILNNTYSRWPKTKKCYMEYEIDSDEEGLQTFHAYVEDVGYHKVISKPVTILNKDGETTLMAGEKTSSYLKVKPPLFDPCYMSKAQAGISILFPASIVGILCYRAIKKYFGNRGMKKQTQPSPVQAFSQERKEEKITPQQEVVPLTKKRRKYEPKKLWELIGENKEDEEPPKPRW